MRLRETLIGQGLLVLALASCTTTPLIEPDCEPACQAGQTCVDGQCRSPFGPCDDVVCDIGSVCVEGQCRPWHPCDDIECSPGEICVRSTLQCEPATDDGDGDGVTRGDGDCNDDDPEAYPGASERCNGADDDCDLQIDEGLAEGAPDCGEGAYYCADADCRCPFWEYDDTCYPPTDCDPGEELVETQGCGLCGERSRVTRCDDSGDWGEPGPWGACAGEGECTPGTTHRESEACGCGTRFRSFECTTSCRWEMIIPWGVCLGDVSCTDHLTEREICAGETGRGPCPSGGSGVGTCTCSTTGFWIDCRTPCFEPM